MNNENESKSVVTSYRLKEDTKEKLKQQLDQLGLTQEQYFSKITNMMEIEMVKRTNIFSVNTEELEELTKRLYNVFINVCEQGNTFLSSKDAELDQLKNKYKDMLLNKDNKITEQKQELQDVYTKIDVLQKENDNNRLQLADIRIKHEKQLEQLESNLKDKTLIVEEYKEKNDMLLSDLSEHKEYKEQYKSLGDELSKLKSNNETLISEKNNLDNTIAKLQDKINNDTERILFHKAEIENKNQSIKEYRSDIKTLEDKKDKQIEELRQDNKKALQEQEKALKDRYETEINKKDLEIEKLNSQIDKLKLRKFKLMNKSRINKDK